MKKKTYPHELIGKEIVVITSTNKHNEGICGIIVDETKSTLVVEHEGKTKRLLKNTITFKLTHNNMVISGAEINKRPEERIKG